MKIKLILLFILFSPALLAQKGSVAQLLAAGIDDAKQYSNAYISPGTKALIFNLSNGWFSTAKAKKPGEFEFSLVGNGSTVDSGDKTFQFNPGDYRTLRLIDRSFNQVELPTVLGASNPDQQLAVHYTDPDGDTHRLAIEGPQGISASGIDLVPSGFLQASLGILKGTELKVRYFPRLKFKGVSSNFYGGALQHEFTSWIPGAQHFPFHVSALIGYSGLHAHYDLNRGPIMKGNGQRINLDTDSWVFTGIVSTDFSRLNFYGGIGYITGHTTTRLKGDYQIEEGPFKGTLFTDPYHLNNHADGVKGTLGAQLKLGRFRLNADYSFQKYNNISGGINFRI